MYWRPAAFSWSVCQIPTCTTILRVSSKSSKVPSGRIEWRDPSPGRCAADLSPAGRGKESGMRKSLFLPPQNIRHLRDVLVAAAGEVDHHQMILWTLRRELHHFGDGMRGLQRRNDAFQPRQQLKC